MRRHPPSLTSLLILVALAADAWARAGGGGNFGGGGGGAGGGGFGGGGSFGGGGGDGDLAVVFLLIKLAFDYPIVGVPLLILIAIAMLKAGTTGRHRYQGGVIRKGRKKRSRKRRKKVAAAVQGADPQFDAKAFQARVRPAFFALQRAWCEHDLDSVRSFISDGIHERFALQLAEQRQLGYRDRMDDLEVASLDLAHFTHEGPLEALTVCITAAAIDYRVDLKSGKRRSGSRMKEPFQEYWTFVRRRGSRTRVGRPGLLEGNCPNCGASVEHNQFAQCESCQSLLRSGEHDWVLAEITQAGEWSASSRREVPGMERLRRTDPDFSMAALEDRASVVFWRWSLAVGEGRTDLVRAVSTPRARAQITEEIEATRTRNGSRKVIRERGVGAVDVIGVIPGEEEVRAVVSVRWSGSRHTVSSSGAVRVGEPTPAVTTWMVLVRGADRDSGMAAGLSSAHCAGCGAPQDALAGDAACSYCGEPLDDGNHGWLLDQLTTPWSSEASRLRGLFASGESPVAELSTSDAAPAPVRSGVLCWMASVARADGSIGPKEREALHAVGRRIGVKGGRVEELIEGRGEPAAPSSGTEAKAWLALAAEVAYADGHLDRTEHDLLQRMGSQHGLSKADVRLILNEVRSDLYQRAKRDLRSD